MGRKRNETVDVEGSEEVPGEVTHVSEFSATVTCWTRCGGAFGGRSLVHLHPFSISSATGEAPSKAKNEETRRRRIPLLHSGADAGA